MAREKKKLYTPTPWRVEEDMECGLIRADTPQGPVTVARVTGWTEEWIKEEQANANHIINCVNLHDELVQALEYWLDNVYPEGRLVPRWHKEAMSKTKEVLAKAKK